MNEYSNIRELKGIGDKTDKLFKKLNIHTVGDLLHYYPRSYDIYESPIPIGQIEEGQVATITGTIYGKVQVNQAKNLHITSIHVKDLTGVIKATWFRMPFLKNTLGRGGVIHFVDVSLNEEVLSAWSSRRYSFQVRHTMQKKIPCSQSIH